jgi:ERCC4-type nuclease
MTDPGNKSGMKMGMDANPGRLPAGRKKKPLPGAYLLVDTSEQREWAMHLYASKHVDFTLREWNLPEGDYAAILASDIPPGVWPEDGPRTDKIIRMEALAIRSLAQWVILIERKSPEDFVGTMLAGHDRFDNECERMRPYGFKCIIVEAGLPEVVNYCKANGKNTSSVIGSIVAFQVRYGIQVFFAGDRRHAASYAYRLLERWVRDAAAAGKENRNARQ